MKKKFISIFLSAIMIVTMLPMTAMASSCTCTTKCTETVYDASCSVCYKNGIYYEGLCEGVSAEFSVDDVVMVAPQCIFGPFKQGYAIQTSKEVKIKNTDNKDLEISFVKDSNVDSYYEIPELTSETTTATVATGEQFTLNIEPKAELAEGEHNAEITVKVNNKEFAVIRLYCTVDGTAPSVSGTPTAERSSDASATVSFSLSKAEVQGKYKYAIVGAGEAAPVEYGEWIDLPNDSSLVNINLNELTAGEKDFYIVLKDSVENESQPLRIEIPAYDPSSIVYTVAFTDGDDTVDNADVEVPDIRGEYTLPENTFTAPDGKIFKGWLMETTVYQPGDKYEVMADITFTAVWETAEPAETYTLTLVMADTGVGGDLANLEPDTVTDIAPGTVVDLSKYWPDDDKMKYTINGQDYYFGGFIKKSDVNEFINSITVSGDQTLYAGWVINSMFTITFDTNGGTMPYEKVREKSGEITQINNSYIPIRSGYNFMGWSLENDGTADANWTEITADCTLYAVWQMYSLSYDDDYDPPPSTTPVDLGGNYEAILKDDVAVIQGDKPISGTLDLGKTDAEAIRISAGAVEESAKEGSTSTFLLPNGTAATISPDGWEAIADKLEDGESLQISVKKLEASYAQMDEWIAYIIETGSTYHLVYNLDSNKLFDEINQAAKSMTAAELEVFLEKVNKVSPTSSSLLEALHDLNTLLTNELEKRQAQDNAEAVYINVGGKRAVFVGAIEADVKAVKANGTTRDIEILADRSNAVEWSTTIEWKGEQQNEAGRYDDSRFDIRDVELYANTDNTGSTHDPELLLNASSWDKGNIRAYKVLEVGRLEEKAATLTLVTDGILIADGTLTASVLSNGNSTYIFVIEPNPFKDVDEGSLYYDAVMLMDQRLLMSGIETDYFGINENITRGMIAAILYRLDGNPTVTGESRFYDVNKGEYYYNASLWAEDNNIISGYGDGTFKPDEPIKNQDLVSMLYRYAKHKEYDVSIGESTNILSYNDAFDISEYAVNAMQWACGEGIISGEDGNLMPLADSKRGEVAMMLMKFLEK